MFDPQQFRGLVIDVLKELGLEIPYSDVAVELLMLTAAHESLMGTYLRQVKGPARGVFQMEPATEQDIYDNYLAFKPNLAHLVLGFRMQQTDIPDLESNLAYQIAMARVHYYRVPEPLPKSSDPVKLAEYWKKYYNTHKGKGKVEDAVKHYKAIL
jgi:hypothetical protein